MPRAAEPWSGEPTAAFIAGAFLGSGLALGRVRSQLVGSGRIDLAQLEVVDAVLDEFRNEALVRMWIAEVWQKHGSKFYESRD